MYKKKQVDYKQIIVIFIVFIVFIIGITYILNKEDRKLTYFEKVIKDTSLAIVRIFKAPITAVSNKMTDKEQKELLEKAASVDSLQAKYDEANKEIKELKELVDLNSTLSENSYLNATVISRNVGYFNNNLIIDKGSKNGIEVGMAVITKNGLIGKITSTSNFNSTVKLITSQDANDKISIKIKVDDDEYVYGLLVGYNEKKNVFIIEGISENTEIPKDSLVTTSGLGNSFPSGILVGKVVNTSKDNFDLARTVEVKSMQKFSGFGYVTILKKEATK